MVYAQGRPLWHISLSWRDPSQSQPVPVLRWSLTAWRRIEACRDRILRGLGTSEPLIQDPSGASSVHWRKPLSIAEINQMAPTPEVIARPGRA
jgi:hypothetical protein